jgi:hypothetical protein
MRDLVGKFWALGARVAAEEKQAQPVSVCSGGPGHVTEHRGNRQVWFQVVVAIRWLSEGGFGGRPDS